MGVWRSIIALAAASATASAPAGVQAPNTTVSGVTVHAYRGVTVRAKEKCFHPNGDGDRTPPRLLDTYPRNGDVVAPGIMVLRLTFDQEMSCGWSLVERRPGGVPDCPSTVLVYPGRRIFRFRCQTRPDTAYELWFNDPAFLHFQNVAGVPLQPVHFTFRTSKGPPTATVHDALMADPDYRREIGEQTP